MSPTKPKRTRPKPPDLLDLLEGSIKAAPWLTPADAAATQLARSLARSLLELEPEAQVRDRVALARALAEVLKDLGLSVAGRVGKPEPAREVTPLDALRNRKAVRIANAKAPHSAK